MKYLLLPLTTFLWYLSAYFGFYYGVVLMIWMFNLSWIWIIIGFPFIFGFSYGLTNGIPTVFRYLVMKLYVLNWFTVIIHSIAGLLGIIMIIVFFKNNPIEYVSSSGNVSLLKGMWKTHPVKLVVLFIPFLSLIFSLMYSAIITPILMKVDERE